jgi:hypothetical protein
MLEGGDVFRFSIVTSTGHHHREVKSFERVTTTNVLKNTQKTEGTAQYVNINHYQYL